MASDYMPDSIENRRNWIVNLKQQVIANAARLNYGTDEIGAFNAIADPLVTAYDAVIAADLAQRQAIGSAQDLFDGTGGGLRAFIEQMKVNPGFDAGMGAAMQIFTSNNTPAPADIKPTLKATNERGHVRLTGSKNYAETVNIYMRRNGSAWMLVAAKRKTFPFLNETPLAQPGIPEQREYMARGVKGDDEIGQDSDIVTVTYAG
jgi:hypothetical protein